MEVWGIDLTVAVLAYGRIDAAMADEEALRKLRKLRNVRKAGRFGEGQSSTLPKPPKPHLHYTSLVMIVPNHLASARDDNCRRQ